MSNSTSAPDPASAQTALAIAALLAGAVAMGISPVFVRLADVGPFASAFWRLGLALPILLAWALAEGGLKSIATAFRSPAVLACGVIFAGDIFFWHLAIMNTTVANATFLATMAPVWVVLGSSAFIGEPVDRKVYLGLGLCLLGGARALIGLALISHAGGQGLLAYALGHVSAAFSSLVIFMEAIAAALVAWVVLGEALGPEQILGGLLILGGIFIARPRS